MEKFIGQCYCLQCKYLIKKNVVNENIVFLIIDFSHVTSHATKKNIAQGMAYLNNYMNKYTFSQRASFSGSIWRIN